MSPTHPSRVAIGGGRWRCVACRREGSFKELSAIPCSAAKVGKLSPEEQVREWAAGRPSCPNDRGECCPDFSCCKPDLLAPVEAREAFLRGSPEERERWLMGFLGAAIARSSDEKVYVTRGRPEEPS